LIRSANSGPGQARPPAPGQGLFPSADSLLRPPRAADRIAARRAASPSAMAATNKCLAQSNKSCRADVATREADQFATSGEKRGRNELETQRALCCSRFRPWSSWACRSARPELESRLGSTGPMDEAQVLPRQAAIRRSSTVPTAGAQAARRPAVTRRRSTVLMAGGLAPQRRQANVKAHNAGPRDD
jgi:hypothetical protein